MYFVGLLLFSVMFAYLVEDTSNYVNFIVKNGVDLEVAQREAWWFWLLIGALLYYTGIDMFIYWIGYLLIWSDNC
jgi:hypothetical protein